MREPSSGIGEEKNESTPFAFKTKNFRMMELTFDHIGIAVFDMDKACADYKMLGYKVGGVKNVDVCQARAAYATKEGSPTIELLQPVGETSPVAKMLKQRGAGPYHTCYGVADIGAATAALRQQGFLPLGKPVPGPGLGNALTVFLYKKSVGLIQIVENNP